MKKPFLKSNKYLTIDDKYNSDRVSKQLELNGLLDEINKRGYDKLTKKEKEKLNELSK